MLHDSFLSISSSEGPSVTSGYRNLHSPVILSKQKPESGLDAKEGLCARVSAGTNSLIHTFCGRIKRFQDLGVLRTSDDGLECVAPPPKSPPDRRELCYCCGPAMTSWTRLRERQKKDLRLPITPAGFYCGHGTKQRSQVPMQAPENYASSCSAHQGS